MDKLATENLFLLEFLVDNVNLVQDKCSCDTPPGELCVSFQFLDNGPLDVCEADFQPNRKYNNKGDDSIKSGKSCLFSLTPEQVQKAAEVFDVYVSVFKKMQPGWLPEKVNVGNALISVSNLFVELLQTVEASSGACPSAKTLKDTFDINNDAGTSVGKIGIYIRMSCFGKLIVTQFQMNLDDKSVLFKDKEGQSLYRYKKAKKAEPKTGGFNPNCPVNPCVPPGMGPGMSGGMMPPAMDMEQTCPVPNGCQNVEAQQPMGYGMGGGGMDQMLPCMECNAANAMCGQGMGGMGMGMNGMGGMGGMGMGGMGMDGMGGMGGGMGMGMGGMGGMGMGGMGMDGMGMGGMGGMGMGGMGMGGMGMGGMGMGGMDMYDMGMGGMGMGGMGMGGMGMGGMGGMGGGGGGMVGGGGGGAVVCPAQPPPQMTTPCVECGNTLISNNTPCIECGQIPNVPPPACAQPIEPKPDPPGNYQEIGACMGGNALTIRVHKDKNKIEQVSSEGSCCCSPGNIGGGRTKTKNPNSQSVCCCSPPPTSYDMRPGMQQGDQNLPFNFKMAGKGAPGNNVTVTPPVCTRPDGTQFTEISDPNKEVFVLRIGKKSEGAQKKANLELELCTPRGPEVKPIAKKETRDSQYEEDDSGKGKKGKGKGKNDKGGNKGAKAAKKGKKGKK